MEYRCNREEYLFTNFMLSGLLGLIACIFDIVCNQLIDVSYPTPNVIVFFTKKTTTKFKTDLKTVASSLNRNGSNVLLEIGIFWKQAF